MRRGRTWLAAACAACLGIACGSESKPGARDDAGAAGAVDAGDAGTGTAAVRGRGAALVTSPPSYALPGETYRYRPKANGTLHGLALVEGPAGMIAREGALTFRATEAQAGRHRVVLEGDTSRGRAAQDYLIDVGASTLRARGTIGVEGGRVIASSSDALHFRGVGVAVPARAVADSVPVTVSELDRAPRMPNARRLRAVRLEPAGTTFDVPAQVTLPLDVEGPVARRRLGAYVYDPSGRWVRVPVLAVDLDNRLVVARAQHFSVYAAAATALELTPALTVASSRSACADSLVGTAVLDAPLADIEAESVNALPEALHAELPADRPTVRDLLVAPAFRGSLRVVQVLELREPGSALPSEQALAVATFHAPGDGSATVTHSDALGNARARERHALSTAGVDALQEILQGRATAVRFATAQASGMSLAARLHLMFAEGDASLEPVDADDLGLATADAEPVFLDAATEAPADVDCDGLLDAYDASDDSLTPQLEVTPREVARAFVGEPVILRARVEGGGAGSWSVLDGAGAELASVAEARDGRAFSAREAGRYLVGYRAAAGASVLEHVFAIDVLAPPPGNTAPTCRPLKAVASARVGELVDLTAVASDAETEASALRVEWGLYETAEKRLVGSPALIASGQGARLLPSEPGAYVLGCRAFDGQLQGAIGTVELQVAPRTQNRPPELAVSPLETATVVARPVVLRAFARDPDGDPLTVIWKVDEQEIAASGGPDESRVEISGAKVGILTVAVEVSDGRASARAVARVHVRDAAAPVIDLDGDGFAVGNDCNDADASIHPGAEERCNARDDDCDGQADEAGACGTSGCPPGTTQDESGGCKDIDECAIANGGCDPLTRCSNTPGGRECSACPPGYAGTGAAGCADIDECATVKDACDPRTECSNERGGYRCGPCPSGYLGTGSSRCVDIDECAVANGGCDPRATCSNADGTRTCGGCPRGYAGSGDTGCADVDECAVGNGGCDPAATCTNLPGTFSCGACGPGYLGGGPAGCSDVDECETANGGCDLLTRCTNTPGGRTCGPCPEGYAGSGEGGCTDVDECALGSGGCDRAQTCVNEPGGYACACPPGFVAEGKGCVDVDECKAGQNTCGDSLCTNNVGSYACGCRPGTFDHAGDGKLCAQPRELTAGSARTCTTTSAYAAFCWGAGIKAPQRVDENNDWSALARTWHACGVREGRLFCWGSNQHGQLGLGATGDRAAPEQVGTSRAWQRVATGMNHTCALQAPGELWCWGLNDAGQVSAQPGQTRASLNPYRVGVLGDWSVLSAGSHHNCAIRLGLLHCWGRNDTGATGSTSINKAQPEVRQVGQYPDWTAVAAGYQHSCGIRGPGLLYCWGSNERGQAGLGPLPTTNGEVVQVGNDEGWTRVSASEASRCGIRAGRLYCWGELGELTGSRTPQQVGTDGDWSDVVSGTSHHCGVRAGALYCWGQNDQGQLGSGVDRDSVTPVPVITHAAK